MALTLGIQELRQPKLLLGSLESVLQIIYGVRLLQVVVVDQVGAVLMNKRVERQTVAPTGTISGEENSSKASKGMQEPSIQSHKSPAASL